MKLELTYEEIADICLHADGGHCESCAIDVAEGFKNECSKINLEKLKKIINKKMEEHYKE